MKSSHALPFSLHPHPTPTLTRVNIPFRCSSFPSGKMGYETVGVLFFSFQCSALLFLRPSVGSCNKWEKIRLSCDTYLPFSTIHPPYLPTS
ncbi:hypothetical protein CDAR_34971 [Caerostris darwini]|uniref:Uncharacterized protein n=1 Tax=Caerostris darwini TaxID=1538125 RepID=A0AAV4MRW2_9ARAC|nr:hypothetical protein CDAR_34971 [Caerostris darwini]